MKNKYLLAKIICRILPPIIAQTIRTKIISTKEGELLALDFVKKSFTGSYFYGNTRDFHAFKFSIHGFFDWRNIIIGQTILKNFINGDIIEVGANIGTETISFADIANRNNVNVYAYEPVPDNFNSLTKIKEKNNLDNLILSSAIVSDYIGTANFKIPTKNDSGSGHITNDTTKEKFQVINLDSNHENNRISLICVDVEGYEYQVLRGAQKIIQTQSPYLIIEVNKNYLENRGNIKLTEIYNFIKSLNYECYYIKPLGLEKIDINNFKIYPNKNWLCIPNKSSNSYKKISNSIFFKAINPCVS